MLHSTAATGSRAGAPGRMRWSRNLITDLLTLESKTFAQNRRQPCDSGITDSVAAGDSILEKQANAVLVAPPSHMLGKCC
jgi:hypothetical protein